MSTFERMLKALDALNTNQQRVTLQDASPREPSIVCTHGRHGRRGRRRNTPRDMSPESLEQRQLLAVTAYYDPVTNGGYATIVAETGDNAYMQKVATVSNTLYVAGDSSFSPDRRYEIPNIDTLERIVVREGTPRADSGVLPSSYPMSQPSITAFTLNGVSGWLEKECSGSVVLTQPDGSASTWNFSNANGNGGFSTTIRLTSGIGVSQTASTGQYYPTSVSLRGGGLGTGRGRPEALLVTWNVAQLPADANVRLQSIRWYQDPAWGYDNVSLSDERSITQSDVLPSVPQQQIVFSLPNAAGPGLNDILLPTFHGTVTLDGVTLGISTGGVESTELRFAKGVETQDSLKRYYGIWRSAGHYNRYISGSVDPTARTVTISVIGISQNEGTFSRLYATDGPFAVQADGGAATLSASYALASAGDQPVTATVFAGHDITNAIDVRLTTPGSTFNVDSPVRVAASRTSSSGVYVQATNVNFDAVVSSPNRLDIRANGPTASLAASDARAVAKINNGSVTSIVIPPGWSGAGFDPDNPPTVKIEAPKSVAAKASLRSLTNGQVRSVVVTSGGSGYTSTPRVFIDPPSGPQGGQTAVADAVVEDKVVKAINVTTAGSGYTSVPQVRIRSTGEGSGATATASIVGSIGEIAVDDAGIGYTPNSVIPVTILNVNGGQGSGASAVAIVGPTGSITRIRVDSIGAGYSDVKIVIPDPPPSTGTVAEAVAVVDPATTRIVRIDVTNPGTGYGEIPAVTLSSPVRGHAATGALASVDAGGSVSAVYFSEGAGLAINVNQVTVPQGSLQQISVSLAGTGYRVGQIVNLASKRGGRPAQVQVQQVSGTGAVLRATIFNAGSGLGVGDVLEPVADVGNGYGYTQAPRVFISRPTAVDGIQAEAVAVLDNEGRVTGITVTNPGSGYDPKRPPLVFIDDTTAFGNTETVSFNAGVGASIYDIRLADDRHTAVEHASLQVSSSGSLAGDIFGNSQAGSANIEVQNGDIYLAGNIRADAQSYLLVSDADRQAFMPYVFTTVAASGSQTGRIFGNTVAITLANDLDTPNDGSVAFNQVSLQTAISSLRVRAARRDGTAVSNPFPYQLSIDETNDISIDAVAASSFPIELAASGNMVFNATLATAGGISISRVNAFTVTAPVSTTKGQISVSANSINITNSLRVLATDPNPVVDDIVLNATGGDITLNGGLVSAVNRVVMNQKNRKTAGAPQSGRPLWSGPQPIRDFTRTTMQVEFTSDFILRNAEVSLDITHTFNPDLSAALIAPDGTRVQLFNSGLSGRGFSSTVFSATATTPIGQGSPPYAGRFQPVASLAALDGRRSRGIWTLEVQDNGTGDVGNLNSFSLQLTDIAGASSGRITGTSRLRADSLQIDAEGAVGDNTVLPGDPTYYLRTDVNTVDAQVGGSFSLSDSGAVDITSLVARGHVSLRADGVDPAIDAQGHATLPALRAFLTDVTAIDASAPNGSIDVTMNTPARVVLGNSSTLSLDASVRAGRVFPMVAAGDVKIRSVGGTTQSDVVMLDAPIAGSGGQHVRFGVTQALTSASYDPGLPGFRPSTLRSNGSQTLESILGVPAGTTYVGDRVLIAGGLTSGGANRTTVNGVYVVKAMGIQWQLDRAPEADTGSELASRTIVVVDDGALVGQSYRVSWNDASAASFGNIPIAVKGVTLSTNIGSDDPNDRNIYVVSTPDGTNNSAGSFGKMIDFRQKNISSATSEFVFSTGITGTIQLQQELPAVTKAFAIDGTRRFSLTPGVSLTSTAVSVDGTRITKTNRNVGVRSSTPVNGITFKSTSGGSQANYAASLAGIRLGGFRQGAAVVVDGARSIGIDRVELGIDRQGKRLANQTGIDVTGGASATTVTNSKIFGSSNIGVRVSGGATGATLVGNQIGQSLLDNKVGVSLETGNNRVGVLPVVSGGIKVSTIIDSFTLALPSTITLPAAGRTIPAVSSALANYLYVGQTVSGANIVPGTRIVAINGTVVTLSAKIKATGNDQITLGAPARNVISNNLWGIQATGGSGSIANSDIVNSTFDGIGISGQGTNYVVGTAPRLGVGSNAIAGNGGTGVSVGGKAVLSDSRNDSNAIRNNYFGALAQSGAAAANGLGNIRLNGNLLATGFYKPDDKSRTDGNGNLHAISGIATATSTKSTTTTVSTPWSPQQKK